MLHVWVLPKLLLYFVVALRWKLWKSLSHDLLHSYCLSYRDIDAAAAVAVVGVDVDEK